MNTKQCPRWLSLVVVLAVPFTLTGCPDTSSKKKTSESHEHKAGEKHDDHEHKEGEKHDHKEGDGHDHGQEKKEKKSGG